MPDATLTQRIKEVIAAELMLEVPVEEIGDDTPLFGPTGLGLDSVDALQLVIALEKHFKLKIGDTAEARSVLHSVHTIAVAVESRPA